MNAEKLEGMDIYCKPGTKVIFSGLNGRDTQLEQAKAILTVGKEYTVDSIIVDSWNTDVFLEGFLSGFNSVFFVTPASWKEANS